MADFSDCTFKIDPRKLTIKQFNHKFVLNEQIMKQQFIRQSNVSPIKKMQQKETNENVNKRVIVSDPCQTFQATSNNFTKQEKPTLHKIIFKNKMVKFSKEAL
jgi:hypothetical protein